MLQGQKCRLVLLAVGALGGCGGAPLPPPADMGRDLVLAFPEGCTDGVRDGNETDVDCGGDTCGKCGAGLRCLHGTDCDSGVCDNNMCAGPSCTDGRRNGMETDVDCGGPCPGCPVGKACLMGADCASASCVNNVCQASPCSNGMKDGMETDVDCGGPTCGACSDGKMCLMVSDCQSMRCVNNVCQANGMATCNDGVKNGAETDVDCGGGMCPKCSAGKLCKANVDCASGTCTAGKCAAKNVSFAQASLYFVGKTYTGIKVAVADFNGDGAPDVVSSVDPGGPGMGVSLIPFMNDGTGKLVQGNVLALGSDVEQGTTVAGDFDGDRHIDVIVANDAHTWIIFGRGDGTFYKGPNDLMLGQPAVADLNNDGKPDLCVMKPVNQNGMTVDVLSAYLNNGNGTFGAAVWQYRVAAPGFPYKPVLDDINGDGKIDIIGTNNTQQPAINVFLGIGNGTFPNQPLSSPLSEGAALHFSADVNADGNRDALLLGTSGLLWAAGKGNGSYQLSMVVNKSPDLQRVAAADMTLDGKLDAVVTSQTAAWLLPGDGMGGFQNGMSIANLSSLGAPIFLVDMNGDKRPDFVSAQLDMMGQESLLVVLNTTQ